MVATMASNLVFSQTLRVADAVNRNPLPFATVTTPQGTLTTNRAGVVDLSQLHDTDSVFVSMLGYSIYRGSFHDLRGQEFFVLLNPSQIPLDEVVVSASRWAQSRRELSQRVTIIPANEIALQNVQTSADLIGQSGEVFIQKSQQGGGSPMIRGFATNRVLISVDGVRMNTAIFRGGNVQNIISIDPQSVESAEVLFGPGSVMYGSDAIGGVMLFQTLEPRLVQQGVEVKGKASTRFSSANQELTTHLDVGVAGKKWASLTSFSFNRFGDLRMGSYGPKEYLRPYYVVRADSVDRVVTNPDPLVQTPSGYSQQNLMQKFVYQPTERLKLEYGIYYSTTTNYSRYDRLLRLKSKLPRSAEWYYGPQEWMMQRVALHHQGNNPIYDEMRLTAAYQRFEESRHDRNFNKSALYHRVEEVDAYSLNADFIKHHGDRAKLFYGLEIVFNDVTSTGTDEDIKKGKVVPGPARYPASNWGSYAAFGGYQYRLVTNTLLHAGLRYNYYSLDATFDTTLFALPFNTASLGQGALTGNLGLTQNLTKSFLFMANLSSAFRSPNVDDIGKVFDSEPGSVVVPNPDLKAEYAYNAEAGFSKTWGRSLKIDLTGYYTYLQNALVRRNFQLNGADSILYEGEMSRVQAIQNAASATVYGVQAAVELNLGSGFSVLGNLTWQKGDEELDDGTTSPLRHAAPLFGMGRLRYTNQQVTLELNTHFSDAVNFDQMPQEEKGKDYMYAIDSDGNPYSPAWYTLNFKTMVRVNSSLNFSGGVENIFDKRYRPYSSGLVAPGRNFVFSLQYSF